MTKRVHFIFGTKAYYARLRCENLMNENKKSIIRVKTKRKQWDNIQYEKGTEVGARAVDGTHIKHGETLKSSQKT